MPSTLRQARFAPLPASYSRLPHDDELYVMKAFTRHCAHCTTCHSAVAPSSSMRPSSSSSSSSMTSTPANPLTLCTKGLQRALDVTQYVFAAKGGKIYSVVDLEGGVRCHVEVPGGCELVAGLVRGIEAGGVRLVPRKQGSKKETEKPTKTKKSKPTASEEKSFDRSYYVPERRSRTTERDLGRELSQKTSFDDDEEERSYYYQTRKPTAEASTARYVVPRTSTSTTGRRFQQLKQQRPASYYDVGSWGRLPVPARDEWY